MGGNPTKFTPLGQQPIGWSFEIAFKSQHMPRMKWTDISNDDSGEVKDNDWKKQNILRCSTWNVQGIAHKEDQVDDILAKKGISIAVISETKKKLQGSKETQNYLQFYSGVPSTERAKAGIMIMIQKRFRSAINDYTFWSERIIQLRLKLSRGYMTIIGVYAPVEGEEDKNNKFYNHLQKIIDRINKSDMVILLGDFNARIGNVKIEQAIGSYGEKICNRNGLRLIDFVVYNQLKVMNTMFDHKDCHKFTWQARNSKSIIDYLICNKKVADMVLDTRVFRGPEIESDHYLLVGTLRIPPRWYKHKKDKTASNEYSFKVGLFRDPSIIWLYQQRMNAIMNDIPVFSTPEEEWDALVNILTQSAKESLGVKQKWIRKKGLRNWDDNIRQIIEDKRAAHKKYISTRKEEDKIDYNRKRAFAKRAVRIKHRESWTNFVAFLENDITRRQPQTYKILKKLNNDIKDNLKLNFIPLKTWACYFQNLWSSNREPLHLPMSHNNLTESIHLDELLMVLKNMKNNKSPGDDSLHVELFKYANINFLNRFTNFLNFIWQDVNHNIPHSWTKSIVIPIYKKGDKKSCDNYRGISLLNAGYKIYSNIIKNKLYKLYENILGEEQNGFRHGRSCCDGYFTLKLLVEKHREFNLALHIAFIDFKKAFDRVNRNKLLQILAEDNIPQQYIQNIYKIYKTNLIAIKINNHLSDWHEISSGVRQGCGLSPLLFIIYMNRIIKEWRETRHGTIKINRNLQIDALLFADDLALLSNNENDLQYSVHNLNAIGMKYDMEINIDKSKIMAFCGKYPIPSKICINNKLIERVNTFNYLGYKLSFFEDLDIPEKIIKFNRTMGIINKVLKPSLVQRHTRTRLYKTLARPTLCYGSEAWTLRKIDERRITTSEMRFMRFTAGYTKWDHIRNEDILKELQIQPVLDFIQGYQRNWNDHVFRMSRNRIPKAVLCYRPIGKRLLGRPKKRWIENSALRS